MPDTEHNRPKTIIFPDRGKMLRRLRDVTGEHNNLDFFFNLVLRTAGKELNGRDVAYMMFLAFAKYGQRFVAALVDDEVVRGDALLSIKQIQGDLAMDKASRSIPPRPELSGRQKKILMRQIKRLVSVYDELVTDHSGMNADYRRNGVDPSCNQTRCGLYLEFYNGSPHKLWTPWGEWTFAGLNADDDEVAAFMERLVIRDEIPHTVSCESATCALLPPPPWQFPKLSTRL